MKNGKIIGALALLAVGAAVGMLLAPDKGSITRKKWMKKGTDIADDLKETFSDFVDSVTDTVDNVEEQAKSAAKKAADFVDTGSNSFADTKKATSYNSQR